MRLRFRRRMIGGLVGMSALAVAHQQRIHARQHEQRGRFAREQAAENGAGERGIRFAAAFQRECAGINAKNAATAVIVTGLTRIDADL